MARPIDTTLAFDRSARTRDRDGRLHVKLSNISKANVCPYYGREIPNSHQLGLDQNKVYMLLRDPEALRLGAATFNNLPLLSKHIKVDAGKPHKDLIVGSMGTDAQFDGSFLQNSLVIWDQIAIDGVETKEQCEISCGYYYNVDWTPGVFENAAYDGRMIDIVGNHVTLVEVGRAGPDVVVGDKKPSFLTSEYKTMKHSRKAIAIRAALSVFLRPQIATDAAIVDVGALVRGVTSATIAKDSARIVADVVAKIPDVDAAALADVIKLAADGEPDDVSEEDDEETAAKKKKAASSAPAMDQAAMDTAIANANAATVARMNAIRQAERDVQPLIGDVIGKDSAAAVYKLALDHAGVDIAGVEPSSYGAMVKMLVTQVASTPAATAPVAMDAGSFAERFPTAAQLKRG